MRVTWKFKVSESANFETRDRGMRVLPVNQLFLQRPKRAYDSIIGDRGGNKGQPEAPFGNN